MNQSIEISLPTQSEEALEILRSPSFVNPVDEGGLKIDKKVSKLLGYLMSDGYISVRSHSNYSIGILSDSDAIREDFKNLLKDIFGVNKFKEKRAPNGTKEVYINSKDIARSLLHLIISSRTRACNNHPKCPKLKGRKYFSCLICKPRISNNTAFPPATFPSIILRDKDLAREALRAAFSADGGVSIWKSGKLIKGKIFLACANPFIQEEYIQMLKLFNITPSFTKNEIRIQSVPDMKIF